MRNRFAWALVALTALSLAIPAPAQTAEVIVEGRRYQVTVIPIDPPTPPVTGPGPKAPADLAALKQAASVDLSWADASADETGFAVWRQSGTGGWQKLALLAAGNTRFTDWSAPLDGASATYRVQAVNDLGSSAYSNEVTVLLAPTVELPAPDPVIYSVRPQLAVPVDVAKNAKLVGTWEINGEHFGAEPGRVLVNFLDVPFYNWSDTRVMIDEPPANCHVTIWTKVDRWYSGMHRRP